MVQVERSKVDIGDWVFRQDVYFGLIMEFNLKFEDDVGSRGLGRFIWIYFVIRYVELVWVDRLDVFYGGIIGCGQYKYGCLD